MKPTRRQLLRSLTASWVAAPGLQCVGAVPLVGGKVAELFDHADEAVRADHRRLASPDFAALSPENSPVPFHTGIRPHRFGGVRLERDQAFETRTGKVLIHNYGHGGAGITLSWGCASVVRDLVDAALRQGPLKLDASAHADNGRAPKAHARPSIAILGGGIIGLTVAEELRRLRPRLAITVYRREGSVTETTSFAAGGQFEPSNIWREYTKPDGPSIDVLGDYLGRSLRKIEHLHALPGGSHRYGTARRRNYTLDAGSDSMDLATPCSVVPPYRRGLLPFRDLNVVGREYSTWLMNPTILLPRLMHELSEAGVHFRRRSFTAIRDVETLHEGIVVNCLGYGAKTVFGDDRLQARSGHVVVLRNPDELDYFFSGGVENANGAINSYMFARQHDIVIGGTIYKGDDRSDRATETDKAIAAVVLTNMQRLFAGRFADCVRPPDLVVGGSTISEG